MPFRSGCCCPQHEEWGFGQVGVKKLFAATYREERFCGAGRCSVGGHKERKRKICSLCRERIQLQMRCEALEAASSSQIQYSSAPAEGNLRDEDSEIVVDSFEHVDEGGENFAGLFVKNQTEDKACHVPEIAQTRQSYECVGLRRKIDLRNEIMAQIDMLLGQYTSLGEQGTQAIMRDILSTRKVRGQFADLFSSQQKSCLGQQKDLFGGTAVAKQLLAEFLNELSGRGQRSCLLFFSSGRTMLLFIDSTGHLYFVDSHSHRDCGALIASAPPGDGEAFADWIDGMMNLSWQTPLTLGFISEVIYA